MARSAVAPEKAIRPHSAPPSVNSCQPPSAANSEVMLWFPLGRVDQGRARCGSSHGPFLLLAGGTGAAVGLGRAGTAGPGGTVGAVGLIRQVLRAGSVGRRP